MMDVYDFNIFYFYFLRYNCAGEGGNIDMIKCINECINNHLNNK